MGHTQMTFTDDGRFSAPTVVIEHLALGASLGEMIEAQTPTGTRACVFELVEIPALLAVLRSVAADDELKLVADDLERLASLIPADLIERRCLTIPLRELRKISSVESHDVVTLAVVSKWQWEIEVAALLTHDDQDVKVKRPGDPELDHLQARLREFPLPSEGST